MHFLGAVIAQPEIIVLKTAPKQSNKASPSFSITKPCNQIF